MSNESVKLNEMKKEDLVSLVIRYQKEVEELHSEVELEREMKDNLQIAIEDLSDNLIKSLEELSDQKEALSRSKEFSETVLNSMNDAISIIDVHDFRIIGTNQVFLDTLGLKREEVIGKTCYEITHHRDSPCVPPDDICPLLDTLKTSKHSAFEHVHLSKEGEKVYAEVSTSPIKDEKGEVFQVVHVVKDITERKRAEMEIKKYAEELLRKLKELEAKGVSRYDSLIKVKNSYLVKEKRHERSLAIFSNLTKFGLNGLCLTTKHPDILGEMYDIKDLNSEYLWLSSSGGEENTINPSNLTELHGKITEFTKSNENTVILFLGLEYLITLNEFEKSFRFLNSITDAITINNSRMLIALDPETLNSRELSLLENALIEIKDEDLIRLGLK